LCFSVIQNPGFWFPYFYVHVCVYSICVLFTPHRQGPSVGFGRKYTTLPNPGSSWMSRINIYLNEWMNFILINKIHIVTEKLTVLYNILSCGKFTPTLTRRLDLRNNNLYNTICLHEENNWSNWMYVETMHFNDDTCIIQFSYWLQFLNFVSLHGQHRIGRSISAIYIYQGKPAYNQ
jgi:hypothetical protein